MSVDWVACPVLLSAALGPRAVQAEKGDERGAHTRVPGSQDTWEDVGRTTTNVSINGSGGLRPVGSAGPGWICLATGYSTYSSGSSGPKAGGQGASGSPQKGGRFQGKPQGAEMG